MRNACDKSARATAEGNRPVCACLRRFCQLQGHSHVLAQTSGLLNCCLLMDHGGRRQIFTSSRTDSALKSLIIYESMNRLLCHEKHPQMYVCKLRSPAGGSWSTKLTHSTNRARCVSHFNARFPNPMLSHSRAFLHNF